jgi:hypothetical protein
MLTSHQLKNAGTEVKSDRFNLSKILCFYINNKAPLPQKTEYDCAVFKMCMKRSWTKLKKKEKQVFWSQPI